MLLLLSDAQPANPPSFKVMMRGIAGLQLMLCLWLIVNVARAPAAALSPWGRAQLVACVLLICCTVGAVLACRAEHRRRQQMDRRLQSLTDGLTALVGDSFSAWRLTGAESDVALLALKGFETREIGEMRRSSAGTVRAQLARVYAKAGVDSRAGLQGLFLEDLMAGLPLDSLDLETVRSGLATE